ncbi:MAG: DUF721 domain-containing protein [Synergistaceae bacterium]|nr:DUF721 domain-containing protein [Synergistaceae bacterium]
MLSEDEKFFINPEYLFPEAARRVKILESLKNSWAALFPAMIARHSFPYNLGINEIYISVDNKNAEEMLKNSRGNILRALKRFDYEPQKNFELKITYGEPIKILEVSQRKEILPEVKITDEELNSKMKGAPESLPEDINHAISHLKIFLEKRFPKKNNV